MNRRLVMIMAALLVTLSLCIVGGICAFADDVVVYLDTKNGADTNDPRDSQESSPAPQLENINSSTVSLLYGPILWSVHDYLKNHSFDSTDLCRQSDASAF